MLALIALPFLAACGSQGALGVPSGFPYYPGAEVVRDSSVVGQVDALYRTRDPLVKVDAFYKTHLATGSWQISAVAGTTDFWVYRPKPAVQGAVDLNRQGGYTLIHLTASN